MYQVAWDSLIDCGRLYWQWILYGLEKIVGFVYMNVLNEFYLILLVVTCSNLSATGKVKPWLGIISWILLDHILHYPLKKTCTRLDLETLWSWPIMPKNLSKHCFVSNICKINYVVWWWIVWITLNKIYSVLISDRGNVNPRWVRYFVTKPRR
jgi:hypothetical protein